jgi:hypothetical protein
MEKLIKAFMQINFENIGSPLETGFSSRTSKYSRTAGSQSEFVESNAYYTRVGVSQWLKSRSSYERWNLPQA